MSTKKLYTKTLLYPWKVKLSTAYTYIPFYIKYKYLLNSLEIYFFIFAGI